MQPTHRRLAETRPLRAAAAGIEARRLRQDLRQTVRDGGLALAFQPRRRLADQASCGADAHLRWPSRGRGVMQAHALMPILDECGLAEDVLAWTLKAACAAAAAWRQGVVCVSVAHAAARQGSLLALVGEALAHTGLPPERLELALPDAQIPAECEATLLCLAALRDAGVGVALEEVGRAGACLVKLKHLPLTTIKLDRSLVRDVVGDRAAAALARSLIDYAHALEIEVAACVETDGQRALLARLGCDVGIERAG